MFLVCHVISQDHVIKGPKNIALKFSHHPEKFGGYKHLDEGNIMAIDYHVIFQDHVFKGHVTLSEGANQRKLPFCQVWWP